MLAVRVIGPATDLRAFDRARARRVKHVLRRKGVGITVQIFLYVRGGGDDLERRPRLVDIANDAVARKRVQNADVVARNIVEIIRRQIDHGKHGEIVGIEHDAARRLGVAAFHGAPHDLFGKRLNAVIDGQRNVQPVRRGKIGGGRAFDAYADQIGFKQNFAVFPRQKFIVILFDARRSRLIVRGKPEHLRRQFPVRINAGVVARIINARKVKPFDLPHGILVRFFGD